MHRPRPLLTRALLALVALAAALLVVPAARAGKAKRYHFALVEVRGAAGVTVDAATVDLIRAQADRVLATHPQIAATLVGAPAHDASPSVWKKYLGKQKLAGAYRVNLEVDGYEETVEDQDPGDKVELRLTIRLSLRMFGEVIPRRTMAFTGRGSSTVKADVGRRLRPKDRELNLGDAVKVAVDEAIAESLRSIAISALEKK
jgi:hypothetical protein